MYRHVYSRTKDQQVQDCSAYDQVLKFSRRHCAFIGTMLTDDLKMAENTFELKSADDMFWLKNSKQYPHIFIFIYWMLRRCVVVEQFNNRRMKKQVPIAEHPKPPYRAPRAPEWDYIYATLLRADVRYTAYPYEVLDEDDDLVKLTAVDPTSNEFPNSHSPTQVAPAQAQPPAETSLMSEDVDQKGVWILHCLENILMLS